MQYEQVDSENRIGLPRPIDTGMGIENSRSYARH